MIKSSGKCSCGKTHLTISLPDTLDKYSPRKCDCEFCITRNISYLSHPDVDLGIECKEPLEIMKQGSGQASFLACPSCKSVIAASIQLNYQLLGALNSTLLLNSSALKKVVVVSPKNFTANEKVNRWQTCWLQIKVIDCSCI